MPMTNITAYVMKKAPSGAFFVLLAFFAALTAASAQPAPPNILLVIADDMGLDASPCYDVGARKPTMRFLERMCAEGLVFDNVYAAPSCSPTRATILTGRYGFRTGVGAALGPRSPNGLSLEETTLFQVLDTNAPQTYAHAVIGKWHLATQDNGWTEHPMLAGVGHYAGVISGTIEDYYNWPLTENGETRDRAGYITSVLTDMAIDWTAQQDTPWFLWLAHVAPHMPFHNPPGELLQSAAPADNNVGQYLAALEALDTELGRFYEALPMEQKENLVVIFLGDNGSPNQSVQEPFSRGQAKGSLYAGGVRVPLVVWGAGVTRTGEREAALVNSTDLFATIAQLAGVARDRAPVWPEDSISFAPLLSGQTGSTRSFAYVEHFSDKAPVRGTQYGWAITDGRYKLLHDDDKGDMFFDLGVDPWEGTDLQTDGSVDNAAAAALADLSQHAEMLRGWR